jgi:hypothetical protein
LAPSWLSHASTSGNGSFGFSLSFNIPAIRKRDRGLPRYCDDRRPRSSSSPEPKTATGLQPDVHWCSISKDNVPTLDARDAKSRIGNPADPDRRSRKFSWLICETRGEKGSAVIYEYKPEESGLVDLAQAHERNRGVSHDSCSDADALPPLGSEIIGAKTAELLVAVFEPLPLAPTLAISLPPSCSF